MTTMGIRPQDDPRYWPCGYCYADAGEPCKTFAGHPTRVDRVHVDRVQSVRLWRRYGRGSM